MTQLPSLDEMSPDAWISAMHSVRESVIGQIARVLDIRTTPQQAAEPLQSVFDQYRLEELAPPFGEEVADGKHTIEVHVNDQTLVLWVFPTEEYESLVYTDAGYWWFDHRGSDAHDRKRHELHRQIALRLVSLLPWANDDDLLEIAAIEIASRAGE